MADDRRERDDSLAPETVASATECTGLMPALPRSDAGDAARASLYGIHAAKGARKRYIKR